ncbi:MAG: hypothetical protein IJ946_01830 [Clostridia bacterium]|nr:hypothetical protein [Clostridia bacterium]
MKRIIAAVLLFVMVFTFAGCKVKDAVFTCQELSITLTEEFKETQIEGYTTCFDSADVAVFVLKEEFSLMVGFEDYTLDQYADLVLQANKHRNPETVKIDGLGNCIKYTFYNEELKQDYTYLAMLYKADTAFWMVQFTCKTEEYPQREAFFIERAKTVTFNTVTAE